MSICLCVCLFVCLSVSLSVCQCVFDCQECIDYLVLSFFYTSTKERLCFHCSLSVCLSVCLCVCVCPALFLWKKFHQNGYTDLDAVFPIWLLRTLAQTVLKLVILDQRSRSRWLNIFFFLHNSSVTSLLYISTLVCLIHLKFDLPFWYALCRFV